MHSTLIVARMQPSDGVDVARLFAEFDSTDMPHLMGTRRRQLFSFHGLYFHLQDFDHDDGAEAIEATKQHLSFVQISDDLKQYISAYDPPSWRSPKDAMAQRFYHWSVG
jgi:cyclase